MAETTILVNTLLWLIPRLKRLKVTSFPEVKVSKFKNFPLVKTREDKVVLGVVLLTPLMRTDWRYP